MGDQCMAQEKENGKPLNLRPVSLVLAGGSALLYGASAISMNFINKLTLQVFGLANTLLCCQMLAVILTVACLRVRLWPFLPVSCD